MYLTSTSRHGQNEAEGDERLVGDGDTKVGQQISA